MESTFDLVVAGAGPAGCVLAAKAAKGGARVLLLERKREPGLDRDWVVDVGRDTFGLAGVPAPEGTELFVEPGTTAIVTSDRRCAVDLPPVPMVPVRNGPYVRKLAAWAQECGASLRCGAKVEGPVMEDGRVCGVRVKGPEGRDTLHALVVADCTGIAGTVRSGTPPDWRVSERLHAEDVVLARRETRRIDPGEAGASMKKGYLWDGTRYDRVGSQGVYSVETFFLDLERGFVDILIGTKPGSGPTPEDRFASVLEEHSFIGEKVFGDGGPIPIRRPLNTFVAPGLVCLGDAACQVVPAHGSGTASALIAADLASVSVLRAIETGNADRPSLWGYCHAFQSGRGALLAYYDVIRQHTAGLTVEDLDMMISKGLVGPADVYSGLVPELPALGPVWVARKLRAGYVPPGKLFGLASSGLRASRTYRHYKRYPPLDAPGALERWAGAIPGAGRVKEAGSYWAG